MTRHVLVTETAAANLRRLEVVLSLPADTRVRVRRVIKQLVEFPELGVALPEIGGANDLRFLLGPWRWMLIVYRIDTAGPGNVIVVAIEDARMSDSVTTRAR